MNSERPLSPELRNWYLSTLGIAQYTPKDAVPVIAPELLEAGVDPALDAVQPSSRLEAEAPQHRPKIVLDLDTPATPTSAASKPSVETADTATTIAAGALEAGAPEPAAVHVAPFRLACWQPVDDFLVIDSLAPAEQPGRDRVQLLANILKALQRLPESGALAQAELIDWPAAVGGNRGGAADEEGARTLLSVFLDARIKQRGVCWVLLMGETAAAYIGDAQIQDQSQPQGQQANLVIGQQRELSGGAKAIVTHSLQTLLDTPASKAETWRAIQFLADQV